ncbi:hypothetical protein LN42_09700 [Marinitoga sp. 1137]|uniref:5-formyltetrahydrofolate cyclo-ligase n=1 Tax=Marinitoga sp. 1137 TaxID=1545835 RepID=UPI00095094A1|nr:5-formyltetrahydrofolate cyclo-ligase [Marinitoga sp. 1137]APT76621.1 hypothetical protein LN42_09700 [Marinitoga sp. 1137]
MKGRIRKEIIAKRKNLSKLEYESNNKIIVEKIYNYLKSKNFKTIAIYYPYRKEVNVLNLMELFKDKIFLFPKVISDEKMIFIPVNDINKLKKGKFGIMEPEGTEYTEDIDIYIVPGVAFDLDLYRLGYGGGFFDRYFSVHKKTQLIGVGFDFQILEKLPVDDHDIQMNLVITEKRILGG